MGTMASNNGVIQVEWLDDSIEEFKDFIEYHINSEGYIIEFDNRIEHIPKSNVKKFIMFDED